MVLDDKSCCGKTEHSFFMVFVFTRYSKKKKKKKSKVDQACKKSVNCTTKSNDIRQIKNESMTFFLVHYGILGCLEID
jgi:hypothetical protein